MNTSMTNKIELLIKKSTLRDVERKLKQRKLDGEVVPDNALEVLRELEDEYEKLLGHETPNVETN